MWWALIDEIAPRAEEMASKKEMACGVRGYHVYKDIWAAEVFRRNTIQHKIFVGLYIS